MFFSHYRAPIHWLVHGHMTSNNETVSRQMPWAGNNAKMIISDIYPESSPHSKGVYWNLEMLIFEGRGKPDNPAKNLSEQSKEPTNNLTHAWPRILNRTRAKWMGVECIHLCFPRISMFPEAPAEGIIEIGGKQN